MSICCPFIEALEQPAGCRAYRAHTSPSTHTPVFTLLHEMLHRRWHTLHPWAQTRLIIHPNRWKDADMSVCTSHIVKATAVSTSLTIIFQITRRWVQTSGPSFQAAASFRCRAGDNKRAATEHGGASGMLGGEAVNLRVPVFFIYIPYKFMLMTQNSQNWLLLDGLSQRHQAGNLGALQSLSRGWMDGAWAGACVTAEAFFSVLFILE